MLLVLTPVVTDEGGTGRKKARNRMPGLPTWRALARGILVFPPGCPCPSEDPVGRGGRVRYPARLPSIRVALVSRRRTVSVARARAS